MFSLFIYFSLCINPSIYLLTLQVVVFHSNTAARGTLILVKVYFSFLLLVQPAVILWGKSSPRKEEGRLFKEEQFVREQLELKPKPGLGRGGGGWEGAISGAGLSGHIDLGHGGVHPLFCV